MVRGGVGKHLLVNLIVDADSFSRGLKVSEIVHDCDGDPGVYLWIRVVLLHLPVRLRNSHCIGESIDPRTLLAHFPDTVHENILSHPRRGRICMVDGCCDRVCCSM